ncbi:FAD/NAD(P)-binding domain-containing protein [Daedalea quercina L-15889]|uniref:FAD/NAD(P)-binding domain-containing protein n=1 Tax=Daedalea quercina L-15889 TaxID=1314783 RepID=A0A165N3C8_9APHY|nr:FAD/NAD(P)-binding domain-containing protein [Daedalea quercina L-15889]
MSNFSSPGRTEPVSRAVQASGSAAKAPLAINFIVIGGGIVGLAAAIALVRAGHRVTVVEKGDGKTNTGPGGMRLPPNMTKVLFHWGLKDVLQDAALTSRLLLMANLHTGQILGPQVWNEELLKETRGKYMVMSHADLHKVLYDAASALHAEIRHNANVVDIEPDDGMVKLDSGEVLQADIIIGADGETGLCRRLVLGREECLQSSGLMFFDVQFPGGLTNIDLDSRVEGRLPEATSDNPVDVYVGNGCAATRYPINGGHNFALHYLFNGDFSSGGHYGDPPTATEDLRGLLPSEIDPNLGYYAHNATRATHIAIKAHEDLDNWVHNSGRLVVIGQAAHPLAAGSIQQAAMGVEDAAVLGKLYSHLSIPEQAQDFLYAFQDLRQQRCAEAADGDLSTLRYISADLGPDQEARDSNMLAKYREGRNVLEGDEDSGEVEQWSQVRSIYAYDCEDEADDWWVQWGLLRARANSDGADRSQPTFDAFDWTAATITSIDETTMS